jgi:hypothetical protein
MTDTKFFVEKDDVQHFIPVEERLSPFELSLFYRGIVQWKQSGLEGHLRIMKAREEYGIYAEMPHLKGSDDMYVAQVTAEINEALAKACRI